MNEMNVGNHEAGIKSRIKFLVVDDTSVMRRLFRIALNHMGYKNIVEVEDGAKAIEELGKHSKVSGAGYSLMILDLNMPEKSGIDVLKFVRENDALKTLPVIVITAEDSKEIVLQILHYGVSEYIIKPIAQKDVMEKVEKVLRLSGKLAG